MTYTTQQLQPMEDAEINEAIAKKLVMVINSYCGDAVMCGYEGLQSTFADRDYCSNPNDIMPLAFERRVGFKYLQTGLWEAYCPRSDYYYQDSNPLRAIACLLLIMED